MARRASVVRLVQYNGQTALPETLNLCDMQRSLHSVILDTVATASAIFLLLYLVFGPLS
jgi:hypothetical protein